MKIKVLYGLGLLGFFVILLKFMPEKTPTNTVNMVYDVPQNDVSIAHEVQVDIQHSVSEKWIEAEKIPSLAGTHIDGDLREDERGNLIVNLSVKDFFDYFLGAIGERSKDQVLSELELQIKARLGVKSAGQAIALLHNYIQYQVHMTSMMQAPLSPYEEQDYRYYADVMSSAFAELKNVRREYFDPATVDAFFSFEETYGDFSVGMLLVEADINLTEEEKAYQIEQLKSQLPEEMQQAETRAAESSKRVQEIRDIYAEGVRDSAYASERVSGYFSEQEVEELFAFYTREGQWEEKMQQYFEKKAEIQRSGLAEADAELAIVSLRDSLFEESEVNRLLSEEAIMRDTQSAEL